MKTVIEMAREAGFMVVHEGEPEIGAWYECFTEEIERFAELVRADERKKWEDQTAVEINEAVLDEREACAKVCDEEKESFMRDAFGSDDGRYDWKADGAMNCADAIRARSNT